VIKKIIFFAVNALCLIAFITCLILSSTITTPLRSQQAARAWGGQSGERFAQVSAFFPVASGFDEDSIRALYTSINRSLLDVSLEPSPERPLYTDAWSASVDVSVAGDNGPPVSVRAIAVGGEFFMFHPLFLRSGVYLSPNDIMKDRVILDEELAWRLFGSMHLDGLHVTVNGHPFIIAGVISRESDFASSKAYTYGAGMYMSFEALDEMLDGNASITTYEIVMPDPITGFALKAITDAIQNTNVHIMENSARFSPGNSFSLLRSFGERSIRTDPIAYPYWENAARITEDWLALLLALSLLFLAFPLVCAIVYLVKTIRFGIKHGKIALTKAINKHDDKKYEEYLQKQKDKLEEDADIDIYNVDNIIREVQEDN